MVADTVNFPRQLPLDLVHEPGKSREELVVSGSNRAAVKLIDNWPEWPSPLVILAGPTGAGKTHMTEIWQARSAACRLNNDDLGAANRAAAIEAGSALIDDADRSGLDENGLFHLINEARGAQVPLLLTSRLFPNAWPVKLPDLASRLRAATTVEIGEPDDMLLAAVITKLFADRQLSVEPDVVTFMTRRIERSLAFAGLVVEAIDKRALEVGGRITKRLAANVINEMDMEKPQLDLF